MVTFARIGTDYQAVDDGNIASKQTKDGNHGVQCGDENPDEVEAFDGFGNDASVMDVEDRNRKSKNEDCDEKLDSCQPYTNVLVYLRQPGYT